MAYKPVYSRLFLEKVLSWPQGLRTMAFETALHACQDPNLNDYKRPYLTPYRQKHPTTDHQYTLYFEIISSSEVFFVWINDQNCLHDTRNELTDPCLKEFKRLQTRKEIEKYDQKFHQIVLEVQPDKSKPIRCRSRLLGRETTLNTYPDNSSYIGHAFFCDEENFEIAKIHVSKFLDELHKLLTTNKIEFQFQFTKAGHHHEISLLEEAYNPDRWDPISDREDYILKIK